MKNYLKILIPLAAILIVYILFSNSANENKESSLEKENQLREDLKRGKEKKKAKPKAEFGNSYLKEWHSPYGVRIPDEKLEQIWKDINNMPKDGGSTLNNWNAIGPYGNAIDSTGVRKFSGRILDIKLSNNRLMIGSASGGLFIANGTEPIPISDQVPSLVIGTFDVQPSDSNVILAGTGEPGERGGAGLYRTSNRGADWTRISLGQYQPEFHRIRYAPNGQTVHAATNKGYYRSTDNGLNWTSYLQGDVSDIDYNDLSPDIVYCGVWDRGTGLGGIYKSTDGGTSWIKMTTNGLPTANVGRVSLSVCRNVPSVIYASIAKNNDNTMLGVYRTAADQVFWSNISPPEDIFDGIGWYVNTISVNPANPALAIVGGIWLWRTSNAGFNWYSYEETSTARNIHADQHEIFWDNSGANLWIGHDGGLSYSNDHGLSYTTESNYFPITQYVNFDIARTDPNVIFGGSRDNSFTGTTNGGEFWKYAFPYGADGGGVAIDQFNSHVIYGTLGVFGGPLAFHRFISMDAGLIWNQINNGIGASSEYYPKIRTGTASPTVLYTNSWNHIYYSENFGGLWQIHNTNGFPTSISNFSVRDYGSKPNAFVYVCIASNTTGQRLRFKKGTEDYIERSVGLPEGLSVRGVTMHPTDSNVAYALMNGFSEGNKIFKTTNQGLNWTNISGNLPDAPMGDLVIHPNAGNVLYLGTEMGCFKTTNSGASWLRWNVGMPEANLVTEMKSYLTGENRFYIIACSYGRGFWLKEEVPGGIGITNNSGVVPDKYELHQNYPNPFNPNTFINFSIPKRSFVKLTVYDMLGKEVAKLVQSEMDAGSYKYELNGGGLASGIYFYTLNTGSFMESKKMMLVK
jgi:hypothetical protein